MLHQKSFRVNTYPFILMALVLKTQRTVCLWRKGWFSIDMCLV